MEGQHLQFVRILPVARPDGFVQQPGQRGNVVVGAAPTFDLTVKKGKELLVTPADLLLEIGMGLDLYYPFFI